MSKVTIEQESIATAKKKLIGLTWEDDGVRALRSILDTNQLMMDIVTSDSPITLSEDFIITSSAFAKDDLEKELYEVLATKEGLDALEEMLTESPKLVEQLGLSVARQVLDKDWNPESTPWV